MQLYFKKIFYMYAFIISINLNIILSIKINKILFITPININKSNFWLNTQALLMPKPSKESEKEKLKESKLENELLKETLKKIKEESEEKVEFSTKEDREEEINSWKVILYNDDIHHFTYVTESIVKCVPQLSLPKAHLITLEAHKNGQAEILKTWKEKAEQYCRELQKYGLTVCTINDIKKN